MKNIRQRFTGYEKDSETGLDFAEARYYNNAHGRFTAVDPLLASGKSADPQTFNRYAYVANNPIHRTDPSGMDFNESRGGGGFLMYEMGFNNWSMGGLFESKALPSGQPVPMGTVSSIQITTTTYTITQNEYKGNDKSTPITQQATVIVNRIVIKMLSEFRRITYSSISYSSSAANSGVGGFSPTALDRMSLIARRIVETAYDNGRDVTLFLAIAQRETHLGAGAWQDPGNVGNPAMALDVNPLQLDSRSGIAPSATDWKFNISQSMKYLDEVMQHNFPNAKSRWNASLEVKLQTYNGGGNGPSNPRARNYSADVLSMRNSIRVSTNVQRLDLFGNPLR